MSIAENIRSLVDELGKDVKLIAVTKTQSIDTIMEAYRAGHRCFGENKVQELITKYEKLPKDIEWHLIGHLQTNKVKHIASFIGLIHGVDSMKLLLEIEKEGNKAGRVIPCLLQVKIAREETKFGLTEEELYRFLEQLRSVNIPAVRIAGLMGMATFTGDQDIIRSEFRKLVSLFRALKTDHFKNDPSFCELSMGMSGDYKIAVQEGSTMVRIGTLIFGERHYNN
jgi:pyridoxal phosphate enzyme (YggS family)